MSVATDVRMHDAAAMPPERNRALPDVARGLGGVAPIGMNIAVLGATGSIGTQTLDVVRNCLRGRELVCGAGEVRVVAMSGFSDMEKFAPLVREFSPEVVWVPDGTAAAELSGRLSGGNTHASLSIPEILTGDGGLVAIASECSADVVVNALVGGAGLAPTLAAIGAGKDIALANKETLVTAGELVMGLAREKNVRISPIDSEHSAIWQCLQGSDIVEVEKILLTASGGPFRGRGREEIAAATARDALKHPNWSMGAKITIDSATLMNKGLELIEAMHLFNQPPDKVEILVHPQSIIHSMVQFIDGSVVSQMGLPDMRLPILYALSAPRRVATEYPRLDFLACGDLTFEPPDMEKFPCLALARHAAATCGTLPAVMNFINEWAVGQFLQEKIGFYEISDIISEAFGIYNVKTVTSIADIREAEEWASEFLETRKARPAVVHAKRKCEEA
ncbi:MAG: 1-deoxy-D-xylulose-5-phosphate reductoisomerase [Defluviitaleaceae bacterium]|nr:1-deoxy-D-xylulose-5-phosphate reductoisomerase [Defluviitaleaceae bacterium]